MKLSKDEMKVFYGSLLTMLFCLLAVAFFAPCCFGAEIPAEDINVGFYYGLAEGLGLYEEVCEEAGIDYETAEFVLVDDMKEEYPEGTVVVEIFLGKCLDERGNGCVLNTVYDEDYITYAEYDETTHEFLFSWNDPGDIVMSFCVYKYGNYEDVFDRYDYLLDTDQLIEEY